jgi:hypothetical protein
MTKHGWQPPADRLDQTSLRALLAGEIPAIRLAGFATAEECRAFCAAIRSGDAATEAAGTAPMTLIGANFANYVGPTKAGYFAKVEPSYRAVGVLTARAGFDPLQRMTERLRQVWPAAVGVATEPGHGRYFAGGVKTRTASGHLHYDFAPHSAAGYAIAEIDDQLGWNLYLDMPEGTGETTTWRRPVPRDGGAIGHGERRALDLQRDYVEGTETFTFRPEVGEVVIINTRHPHDIRVDDPAEGQWRAQTSSFIGHRAGDDLIMWS